jgi:hypothetical protein
VAGHRQFHAAAEREALHARDHRFAEPLDRAHQSLSRARESLCLRRCVAVHRADVGAGDEGLVARAGQHHHAYRVVLRGLAEGDGQLVERVAVERVELVGPVDGDRAHRAAVADLEIAIGHGRFLERMTGHVSSGNLCRRAAFSAGSGAARPAHPHYDAQVAPPDSEDMA